MQQVYWLLRNNRESGPFTIDELLQQPLQAGDLFWQEGKSHTWSYPSELEELNERLNTQTQPSQLRRRADEIEQRAEALRQRVLNYHPPFTVKNVQSSKASRHQPDLLRQADEENIEFVDHTSRGFSAYDLLAAAMITCIVGGVVYGGGSLYNRLMVHNAQTSQAIVVKEEKLIPKPIVAAQSVSLPVSAPEVLDTAVLQAPPVALVKREKRKAAVNDSDSSHATENLVTTHNLLALKTEPEPQVTAVVKEEPPVVKEPAKVDTVAVQPEKKKTLGQVLKGLFKKKKKEEPAVAAAAQQ